MTLPAVDRTASPPPAAAVAALPPAAPQQAVAPGLAYAGMIARGADGTPAYVFSAKGQWDLAGKAAAPGSGEVTPLSELPEYRLVATGHGREWQLFASQAFFEKFKRPADQPQPTKADMVVEPTAEGVDPSVSPGEHPCAATFVQKPDGKVSLSPQVTCFKDVQNLGLLKKEVTGYFQSEAYQRDVRKVADEAKAYMKARADEIVAHGGKLSDYGIVLDIDETSLFNVDHMEKVDYGYNDKDEKAWEHSGQARAIKPTLELYKAARALGLKVFFVTGRKEQGGERQDTISNLWRAGYTSGWQKLVMVQPGKRYESVADYKGLERQKIEQQGCHILFTMGDQWSDLAPSRLGDGKEHAEKAYKLPNPAYFIP